MLRAGTLATVLLLATASAAPATTYTVTNGGDAGAGTLRQAILDANDTQEIDDEIVFTLAPATPVEPTAALPAITARVTIRGDDCGGTGGVAIEGNGGGFDGLHFADGSDGSRLCNVNVRGFSDGIQIDEGADGVAIETSRVGTNGVGTMADPNARGIFIDGASDTLVVDNVISGNTAAGVVLHPPSSGQSSGNLLQANRIGLNLAGDAAIPNGVGVEIGPDVGVTVGGTDDGNVISGNTSNGVVASAGIIAGNLIGTNIDGSAAIAGQGDAVEAEGGSPVIEDNVIAASHYPVGNDGVVTGMVVRGNLLGLLADGTEVVHGDTGINLTSEASGTLIEGNTIVGNGGSGIETAATNTTIRGNTIGRDTEDGATAETQNEHAINIISGAVNTVIGGAAAGDGNRLSNSDGTGVDVSAGLATLQGNHIDANTGGGVRVDGTGTALIGGTAAGAGNVIEDNGDDGVEVLVGPASILGNSIRDNGAQDFDLGIDLAGDGLVPAANSDAGDGDAGPNDLQNPPVITGAATNSVDTTVTGTIDTTPARRILVEAFANAACDGAGNGEGDVLLGRTEVVAGSGPTGWSLTGASTTAGRAITATATDLDAAGDPTSEFSACFTATQKAEPPPPPEEQPPAEEQPPPPPPPPPLVTPPPASPFVPVVVPPKFPAKVAVLRNGVDDGRLDMLIQITSRAVTKGAVLELDYQSSGKHTRFEVPIKGTQIKVRKKLPKSQPKDTGIVEIEYDGNDVVAPDDVRLRAADGKSKLTRKKTEIDDGRLIAEGTVTKSARGVVRIRLGYDLPTGESAFLNWNAKIRKGKWKLSETLPDEAAHGGQLSIQFTGYEKKNLRGEQIAKQVLATG